MVLDKGRIEQMGTPEEVYEQPASAFVHEFIGESNTVPIEIANGKVLFDGRPIGFDPQGAPDGKAKLFLRPHEVAIEARSDAASLEGVVKRVHGLGPARRVEVLLREGADEHLIEVGAARDQTIVIGQTVALKPQQFRIFSSDYLSGRN